MIIPSTFAPKLRSVDGMPRPFYDIFLKGLSDQIQDLLVPLDLPSDLDSLITLAIRTDNRLQERQRSRTASSAGRHQGCSAVTNPSRRSSSYLPSPIPKRKDSSEEVEEPMQLGRAKLSTEERHRCLEEGRCFYCGQQGHLLAAFPAKRAGSPIHGRVLGSCLFSIEFPPRALTEIKVNHHDTTVGLGVLIDSGADESLMHWDLAKRLQLKA